MRGSQWGDPGWTGVREGSLSPLLKIQLTVGFPGLCPQEGLVLCVSQGTRLGMDWAGGSQIVHTDGGGYVSKHVCECECTA